MFLYELPLLCFLACRQHVNALLANFIPWCQSRIYFYAPFGFTCLFSSSYWCTFATDANKWKLRLFLAPRYPSYS